MNDINLKEININEKLLLKYLMNSLKYITNHLKCYTNRRKIT